MINQDQLLSMARWILTVVGGWAISKGYVTADQLVLIGGALASLIPLAWSLYVHTTASTIKAGAGADGVGRLVMTSQAAADAVAPRDEKGVPQPDNILSPAEDLDHVSKLPDVKAVVMKSKAAADAIPSPSVVGPAALTAAASKG